MRVDNSADSRSGNNERSVTSNVTASTRTTDGNNIDSTTSTSGSGAASSDSGDAASRNEKSSSTAHRGLKLLVGETASIKSLPKKTADKIISYLSYDSSKRYRCVFQKRPECDFDLCEKCFNHGLGNVSKG